MDSSSSELEKMSNDTFFHTCKFLTLEELNELRVTSKLINDRVFQYIKHNIKTNKYTLTELKYISTFSKTYEDFIDNNCCINININNTYDIIYDDQIIYINSKNIKLLNVLKSVHKFKIKKSLNENEIDNKNSVYNILLTLLKEHCDIDNKIIKNIYNSMEDLNDNDGINITSNECYVYDILSTLH